MLQPDIRRDNLILFILRNATKRSSRRKERKNKSFPPNNLPHRSIGRHSDWFRHSAFPWRCILDEPKVAELSAPFDTSVDLHVSLLSDRSCASDLRIAVWRRRWPDWSRLEIVLNSNSSRSSALKPTWDVEEETAIAEGVGIVHHVLSFRFWRRLDKWETIESVQSRENRGGREREKEKEERDTFQDD